MKDFEDTPENSTVMFKNFVSEIDSEELVFGRIKELSRIFEFFSNKKKKSKEEEMDRYYNVHVYQVLPYPPGAKFNK